MWPWSLSKKEVPPLKAHIDTKEETALEAMAGGDPLNLLPQKDLETLLAVARFAVDHSDEYPIKWLDGDPSNVKAWSLVDRLNTIFKERRDVKAVVDKHVTPKTG